MIAAGRFWAAAAVVICTAIRAPDAGAGDWITDAGAGCRVWNPHPEPNETLRWLGACANGFAQGRGAAQWFRNNLPFESDEGEWREGRQTGYGTQVWPSGRYEGELVDAEPNGHGVLTLGKARFEGEFRAGKPNGIGTLSNGSAVYSGAWTDGCFRDGTRRAAFGAPPSSCR